MFEYSLMGKRGPQSHYVAQVMVVCFHYLVDMCVSFVCVCVCKTERVK